MPLRPTDIGDLDPYQLNGMVDWAKTRKLID